MAYVFAVVAFVSTSLGGFFTLRYRDKLHRILGFASGILLGAVFFDLLPESFHLTGSQSLTRITVPLVIGFLVFHILQRLFFLHPCPEEEHGEQPHHPVALMGAGTFILHSFFDGLAIGISFNASVKTGILVALAVIAHDFSDGLNTVSLLLRHNMGESKAKKWLLMDAAAPLIGVAVAKIPHFPSGFLASLLAVFAGFFLYIATADLLPETHHEHKQWQTVGSTVLGAVLMFLIASILR